jgi:hypothetical protein
LDKLLQERRQERRIDPMLATLVDVALAYRENLGSEVAQAFMRETGVPAPLVQRVLAGSARQRSGVPRRWAIRGVASPPAQERTADGAAAP